MSETPGVGEEVVWWAALTHVPGVGAATMHRLVRVFGSPAAAVQAAREDLVARGGLTPVQAEQVAAQAADLEALRARLARAARHGIALLCLHDPAYPRRLLDLSNPPPLLYLQGEISARDTSAVAIVGTRTPDAEGARLAREFARGLATGGICIVSGLAHGIDTAAHRGALEAEEGRSIAFLGCGLLRVYPPENVGLAGQLARHGALASEVPPETEVSRGLLLARDRLQAAMARAVIVVQAHRKCGSLVTARHARQCGRPVFGVPWKRPPFSEGWEELEKLGARPITAEADLTRLLEAAPPPPEQRPLL